MFAPKAQLPHPVGGNDRRQFTAGNYRLRRIGTDSGGILLLRTVKRFVHIYRQRQRCLLRSDRHL